MSRRRAIIWLLGLVAAGLGVLGLAASGLVNFQKLEVLGPPAQRLFFPDAGPHDAAVPDAGVGLVGSPAWSPDGSVPGIETAIDGGVPAGWPSQVARDAGHKI